MRKLFTIVAAAAAAALLGSAAFAAHSAFSDVEDGGTHTDGIHWAAQQSIVKGFEDGTFRPHEPVTRGQVASMLHRYDSNADDTGDGQQGPRGPRGPQGPQGPQGPVGADGVSGVVIPTDAHTIPAQQSRTYYATECPSGTWAISGGWRIDWRDKGARKVSVTQDKPNWGGPSRSSSDPDRAVGWVIGAENKSGHDIDAWTWAICATLN